MHELIDRLDDEQARRLAETLRGGGAAPTRSTSRPLSEADIVLAVPLLPDDENADITHNPDDFRGIEGLLVISEAPASSRQVLRRVIASRPLAPAAGGWSKLVDTAAASQGMG